MTTYVEKRARDLNKKIVDSKEPIRVEVIPQDIERAKQKDSKCCAFVRACERQLPGVEAAFVFRTKAWIEYEDKIVRFDLPKSVQKEIVAFDRAKAMEPGLYQFNRIAPSSTMKAKKAYDRAAKERDHKNKGRKPNKKRFIHYTTNVRGWADPSYRAEK